MYIYVYTYLLLIICIYTCVCVYIYIYIYIRNTNTNADTNVKDPAGAPRGASPGGPLGEHKPGRIKRAALSFFFLLSLHILLCIYYIYI